MKKSILPILLIPLLIACNPSEISSEKVNAKEINIYSLNDTHGDLIRDIDTLSNGMESISGLINKDIKANKQENNLFICLGDMFQGQYVSEYTKGKAIVDALNYLDCKAFVLGNHEFDWTLEEMHKYKDGNLENGELNCDLLGANIIETATNKIPDWIKPYTIIEEFGHKIGLIGFMGEGIENTILPGKLDGYKIVPSLPLYEKYSQELKQTYNCDLILAAVHDYKDIYKDYGKTSVPPATIFGAHTHEFKLEYIQNDELSYQIPFIQAGCDNKGISKVKYIFDDDNNLKDVKASIIKNDNPDDYLDEKLANMIKNDYQEAFEKGNKIIAKDFPKMNEKQWAQYVGKLLYLAEDAPSDLGIINYSSVRLSTKNVKTNDLLEKQMIRILPYANKILHVKINKDILDTYMKENGKDYYFAINNKDISKDYYIVNVIDFVFNMPQHQNTWKHAEIIKTLDLEIRDFVVKEIKHKQSQINL